MQLAVEVLMNGSIQTIDTFSMQNTKGIPEIMKTAKCQSQTIIFV